MVMTMSSWGRVGATLPIAPADISPQGAGSTLDADLLDGFHAFDLDPTENSEMIPLPEGRVTGNSTRAAQTNFDGAAYFLRRNMTVDRLIFRVTAQAGAPTGRFLIYQFPGGGSGIASLIASATAVAIGATGNFEIAFAEGTVTLEKGLIYILWGRDSGAGSFTLRTYTTQSLDLMTANMNAATHPTSFTTVISAATTPATFDPLESGDADATSTDVIGVYRLRNV